MSENVKLIGSKLIISGYLYYHSRDKNGRSYWDCKKLRERIVILVAVSSI